MFKTTPEGPQNIIGMLAVQEASDYCFIRLQWIIRSLYLEPTFDKTHKDYWYVNDILNTDTYLLFLAIIYEKGTII